MGKKNVSNTRRWTSREFVCKYNKLNEAERDLRDLKETLEYAERQLANFEVESGTDLDLIAKYRNRVSELKKAVSAKEDVCVDLRKRMSEKRPPKAKPWRGRKE